MRESKFKVGDWVKFQVAEVRTDSVGCHHISPPDGYAYQVLESRVTPADPPEQYAELRSAVIHEALTVEKYYRRIGFSNAPSALACLLRSTTALRYASTPPDPVARLVAAAENLLSNHPDNRQELQNALAAVKESRK